MAMIITCVLELCHFRHVRKQRTLGDSLDNSLMGRAVRFKPGNLMLVINQAVMLAVMILLITNPLVVVGNMVLERQPLFLQQL